MRILVTGKGGQIGHALELRLKDVFDVIAVGRDDLDLLKLENIGPFMDKVKPDMVIHPAAYTAVDQAESEAKLCYQINVAATQILAEKANEFDIPFIFFSTDYVFDGLKKESYLENDQTNPQSVYGKTKSEAEEVVRKYKKHIILRTSWVFGSYGHNFLKTILKLIQEKNTLSIVHDQKGSPASVSMLADVTLSVIQKIIQHKDFKDFGTYHVTNDGDTNWHDYATFVCDEAVRLGVHVKIISSGIKAIPSEAYPTAAKRPLNSKLNTEKIKKTFMLELPHWKDEVKKVLKELTH